MALNVTVQSYNGRLDYGLIACRRVVPDVADIGDFIVAEHKKLMELMATELAAQAAAAAALPAAEEATTPSAKPAKAPRAPRLKLVPESANPAAKPVPKARAVSSRPRRKAASA
jgi:hypothetical protein